MLITTPEDTRSNNTEKHYRVVSDQQVKKYEREHKITVFPENVSSFIDWLSSRKPKLLPKSWRQYKNAVAFVLEEDKYLTAAASLRKINSDGCKSRSNNPIKQTSSLKKKHISEYEEDVITSHLKGRKNRSKWAIPCLAFFKAGIILGLRPSEWPGVKLFVDGSTVTFPAYPVLRVENGKATNGRSHGKYRHLILDRLSEEELMWVRLAIAYSHPDSPQGLMMPKGRASDFEEYYDGLRKEFARTIFRIFPKKEPRISLYSCRHQFSANIKLAKFTLSEIAALMGHATDDTASAHYGRKRFGRSNSGLPRPLNEEVQKIRLVYEARPDTSNDIQISPTPNSTP